MAKKIKIPFAQIQKITMASLCVFCTLLSWSCINIGNPNLPEPLSDEQISINLSENGKSDPELLIGVWDAIAFAYTAEGKRMSNRTAISKGRLIIPKQPFIEKIEDIEDDWEKVLNFRWHFSYVNSYGFFCLFSAGNEIELIKRGSTYIYPIPPNLEYDLICALTATISFVINGNELIFYFPKIEDNDLFSYFTVIEKNKTNLLIFKKNDKP